MKSRYMTKEQVNQEFREYILPMVKETEAKNGNGIDRIMRAEAWSNYVDSLNKDRRVSDKQAFSWSNPY